MSDVAPIDQPVGYTLFAVLALPRPHVTVSPSELAELDAVISGFTEVTMRGLYDVSGMRAEADLIVWLHGPTPEQLQRALRDLRRTVVLARAACVWSAMGVHREAEFSKSHIPGFLRGVEAKGWLCLYPFVRSYEWYLLPESERAAMLAEHGRKGAAFTEVLANTVSTFGLSDYEWLLPLESDDPVHLVDMMRELRATQARLHVREEVPFYTGRRVQISELSEVLGA